MSASHKQLSDRQQSRNAPFHPPHVPSQAADKREHLSVAVAQPSAPGSTRVAACLVERAAQATQSDPACSSRSRSVRAKSRRVSLR